MIKLFTSTVSTLALAIVASSAADLTDFSKLDLSKLPPAASRADLTYEKDIRPLFQASCLRCHGEQRARGDLRLDTLDAVLKGGKDGKVVEPGDSKKSRLLIAVAQLDPESAMPPRPGPGRGPGGGGPGGPPGGP